MEAAEYDRMHALEQQFWWYRALHAITLQRIQKILAQSNFQDTFSLLDAGCGTGGLLHYLNNHRDVLPITMNLFGLEFDAPSALRSKAKSQAEVVSADINRLPFDDDSFNIITSNDVLYHQNVSPLETSAEFYRVLKPGGSVLIHLPAFDWMQSAHDQHVHTRERYNKQKCTALLTQQGFQVKRCAYWNSLLFPIMIAHRLTGGKHKSSSDVEAISPLLDTLLYRIISLEKMLTKINISFPFGGSVWAWAIKPQ